MLQSQVAIADPTKEECVAADETAQPLRRSGHLRDALLQLKTCIAASCPGPVRDDCSQRLDELQKALPTIVFIVQGPDGRNLSTVRVAVDGVPFADNLSGVAAAIDPGEHRVTFDAEGLARADQSIVVREGEKERRVQVSLAPAAVAPAPTASSTVQQPEPQLPEPHAGTEQRKTGPFSRRTVAFAALGAGAGGLLAATIFGVAALGNKSTLDGECGPDKTACPTSAQSDLDALRRNALISDVCLGVGVVGVGIGAVLYLLDAGRTSANVREAWSTAPGVTPWLTPGGVGLQGKF